MVAGTGLISGDVVNVSATGGGFDDKSAGSNKSYTLTGLTLGGANSSNYVLASGDSISGINGIIDAKTLGVTGLTVTNKAYDATTTATLTGTAALLPTVAAGANTAGDGKVYTGDVVTLDGSITGGTYNSANVATANSVTVAGLSLGGGDAANYILNAAVAGSITPKLVTIAPAIASKTYDKTTALTVSSAPLTGMVGTQSFTVTATGVLDDASAGARIGTISYNYTLPVNGAVLSNYDLPTSGSYAVTVLQKGLTVTGATGLNKTYDASSAMASGQAGNSGITSGVLTGDTVTLSGAPTYASANVLRNASNVVQSQAIEQGTLALSGASAPNYRLVWTNGSGRIDPITLSLNTAPTVADKMYDGNTQASVTLASNSATGYVSNQTLTVTPAGTFASADAGIAGAKSGYTVSFQLADGTNGGKATNYDLPDVAVSAANSAAAITPKTLSLTGLVVSDKTYDGNSLGSITSQGTLAGLVGTEAVTLGGTASANFRNAGNTADDQNAGLNKTALVSGLTLADSAGNGTTTTAGKASNYILGSGGNITTTASILPKAVTISGITVTAREYDGTSTVQSSDWVIPAVTTMGVLVGDAADVTLAPAGTYDTQNAGANQTVALDWSGAQAIDGAAKATIVSRPKRLSWPRSIPRCFPSALRRWPLRPMTGPPKPR